MNLLISLIKYMNHIHELRKQDIPDITISQRFILFCNRTSGPLFPKEEVNFLRSPIKGLR